MTQDLHPIQAQANRMLEDMGAAAIKMQPPQAVVQALLCVANQINALTAAVLEANKSK